MYSHTHPEELAPAVPVPTSSRTLDSAKLEETVNMSQPSDPAAEAESLEVIKDKIEFTMDRMKPSRVKLETVFMMKKQIQKIREWTEKYSLGVGSFLIKYSSSQEGFKEQVSNSLTEVNDDVEIYNSITIIFLFLNNSIFC